MHPREVDLGSQVNHHGVGTRNMPKFVFILSNHASYLTKHGSYLFYHASYLTYHGSYPFMILQITQKYGLNPFISCLPCFISNYDMPQNLHIYPNHACNLSYLPNHVLKTSYSAYMLRKFIFNLPCKFHILSLIHI